MNIVTRSFGELVRDVSAGSPRVPQSEYLPTGRYPIIDQGQGSIAGYTDDERLLSTVDLPTLVFGDHTRRLKYVDTPFAVGADGVKLLQPSAELDVRYAFHFLRSIHLPNAGYSRHYKFLKEVMIPLLELPEQRRVAAILDRVDDLRDKRDSTPPKLSSVVASALDSLMRDSGYSYKRLGDVAETTSGGTPSRSVKENFGGGIPWVKSSEVAQGVVVETEESITSIGLTSSSARVMPVGTVLVAMYGATAGTVGQLGIEAATNQAICCISPNDAFTPEFLVAALSAMKSQLKAMAVGGAQPNLSQGQIRDLRVPVPPIHVQEDFTRLTLAIRGVSQLQTTQVVLLDELFSTLQDLAFRGAL